ncbi:MAG: hypothetical protein NT033_04130, partial [Candidatus Omnitrophica bacterium]|nr:hypothetical protein [Candidatus Omnitrophota bacterium]
MLALINKSLDKVFSWAKRSGRKNTKIKNNSMNFFIICWKRCSRILYLRSPGSVSLPHPLF